MTSQVEMSLLAEVMIILVQVMMMIILISLQVLIYIKGIKWIIELYMGICDLLLLPEHLSPSLPEDTTSRLLC